MGERKVLNKYIPPDFDPSLVPRGRKLSAKDGTVPVRMMLPFSIQCGTCHTFLYRGRKFNSKKEAMGGPDGKYLGITRWRFYISCTQCARPITFLTDPKHADYEMESGGTRNFEMHREATNDDNDNGEEAKKYNPNDPHFTKNTVDKDAQDHQQDPIQALENRVLESQRELKEMDELEEIKAMNARHVQLLAASGGPNAPGGDPSSSSSFGAETRAILQALDQRRQSKATKKSEKEQQNEAKEQEEDEALIRSIQFGKPDPSNNITSIAASSSDHSDMIRRLDATDEERLDRARQAQIEEMERQIRLNNEASATTTTAPPLAQGGHNKRSGVSGGGGFLPTLIVKAKKKRKTVVDNEPKPPPPSVPVDEKTVKEEKSAEGNIQNGKSTSTAEATTGGLAGLLGGYDSDDD